MRVVFFGYSLLTEIFLQLIFSGKPCVLIFQLITHRKTAVVNAVTIYSAVAGLIARQLFYFIPFKGKSKGGRKPPFLVEKVRDSYCYAEPIIQPVNRAVDYREHFKHFRWQAV